MHVVNVRLPIFIHNGLDLDFMIKNVSVLANSYVIIATTVTDRANIAIAYT